MTLCKIYSETKPIGVLPLCAFGGLEILDIEYGIDDVAIACFSFEGNRQQIRPHKIYTSSSGRLYIRKQGVRYYFDEIMRI